MGGTADCTHTDNTCICEGTLVLPAPSAPPPPSLPPPSLPPPAPPTLPPSAALLACRTFFAFQGTDSFCPGGVPEFNDAFNDGNCGYQRSSWHLGCAYAEFEVTISSDPLP